MTQLQGGSGIGLMLPPLVPQASIRASAPFYPSGNNTATNELSLASGQTWILPPGTWLVQTGSYTWVQFLDAVTGQWRSDVQSAGTTRTVRSDGVNVRLANLTGAPVGAFMTNVGSAYTSAPTVTASAGSSTWTAVVGGAVSGTVTVTTGGTYTYVPTLVFAPPPSGGIQASGVATVSGGTITAVTVTNQGGGYAAAPAITIVPDPRDTVTTTGVLTTALTGSGTVTGLIMTSQGLGGQTAVPTLSFSGGGGSSAAATVVMCFTATGFSVDTAGVAYGTSLPFKVFAAGGIVAGTAAAVVNPQLDRKVFVPRLGVISGTSAGGGTVTATGAVIDDGGLFQRVPEGVVVAGGGALPTTAAAVTITVGGVTDTSLIQASP